MTHIHLLVPTTTKFDFLEHVARFTAGTDIVLSQSHAEAGVASIESGFDELLAGPGTIKQAIQAQNSGAEAIVIICLGDPALEQARQAVTIPVLGPGQTAMLHACMLGNRFSIIPTMENRKADYRKHARLYGLEGNLASVRPANVPVLDIDKTASLQDVLVERALQAIEQDGADVIILGCGCFKDIDKAVHSRLRSHGHDVPVIDAIPLTVLTALALVKSGYTHGKKAFPFPAQKARPGCDIPALDRS